MRFICDRVCLECVGRDCPHKVPHEFDGSCMGGECIVDGYEVIVRCILLEEE